MKRKILLTGSDNFGKGGRSVIGWNLTKPISSIYKIDFLSNHEVEASVLDNIAKRNGEIKICHLVGTNKITRKFRFMKSLKNMIRSEQYDIIHINADNPREAITPFLASQLAGINRFVIHAHTDMNHSDSSVQKAIDWLLRKYMSVTASRMEEVACSTQAGNYFFKDSTDFTIIENGIDLLKYRTDEAIREEMLKEFSIPSDRLVIGTVARMAFQKNPLFTLEILRELKKIEPNFLFVWVGDGDMETTVKQKASDYSLTDNILFLGARKDVNKILTIFDVFILPSVYEGFGIVNIEAQALGIPCLVSRAIPNTAKINSNFYFYDLNNKPDLWAKRILEIALEPEQPVNLQRFMDRGFDIRQGASKLSEIYQKLLKD